MSTKTDIERGESGVEYESAGRTLVLSEQTTRAYEDVGPLGAETRREVRRDAQILADKFGSPVEIQSHDGITFESIVPVQS